MRDFTADQGKMLQSSVWGSMAALPALPEVRWQKRALGKHTPHCREAQVSMNESGGTHRRLWRR